MRGQRALVRDPLSALRWFERAAEHQDPKGQCALASLLMSGQVGPKDRELLPLPPTLLARTPSPTHAKARAWLAHHMRCGFFCAACDTAPTTLYSRLTGRVAGHSAEQPPSQPEQLPSSLQFLSLGVAEYGNHLSGSSSTCSA